MKERTQTDPAADPKANAPKPGEKPASEPKEGDAEEKVTLTKAQLAEQLQAAQAEAIAEAERKATAAAEKARKQQEADAAKAKGEWEAVAKANEEKAAAAEQELNAERARAKGLQVDMMLRDHLAEKHPDYIAAAKWIRPAVQFEATTKDETIRQRIEEAAAAYVKDNPRAAKGGAAPSNNPGGKIPRGTNPPQESSDNGKPRQITGVAAMF